MITIIECCKDFYLFDKLLLSSAYSRVLLNRQKKDTSHAIKSEIVILNFMTLGADLVMLSDKKRECYDVW